MSTLLPPGGSIPDDCGPADEAMWSARFEILLIVWRINQALQALSSNPNELTLKRWSHGIARELWIAIAAMGLEGSTMVTAGRDEGPRPCRPMQFLLRHVEWKACRSIRFDVQSFDRQAYAGMVASIADRPQFISLDFLWSHPKWWVWGEAGPEEQPAPGWWTQPLDFVSYPMPAHASDLADMLHDSETVEQELQGMIRNRMELLDLTKRSLRKLERELRKDE
ncbi:hypothetical protein C8Q76DRAFT_800934 [Earliella scabrosa]|nr:hypothetical protein C8Q76DRAFT_800934 [Earliella scabrosa]